MKYFLILSIFLSGASPLGAAVYQSIDEEGNITFSDKPIDGAVKRKLEEPAVIKLKKVKPAEAAETATTKANKNDSPEPQKYTSLRIVSPEHDESFQDNTGRVALVVESKPALQHQFNHYFKVTLDGKILPSRYAANSIALERVDRGTHTVSVSLYDKTGKLLKKSPATTFHLRRFSKHFRN